jgi:surface antigen
MRPVVPFLLLGMLGLSACASRAPSGSPYLGGYVGGTVTAECAPFARALSGVRLAGEAADWWWEADGRYTRQTRPEEGSVLVLRRSDRLPSGHVAVVSQVLSARQILVTQANWVHHRVTEDQPVIDVSPRNDWSVVRVWWPPADAMGVTDYPAYGFIRPDRPVTHQQLTASVQRAIRIVGGG